MTSATHKPKGRPPLPESEASKVQVRVYMTFDEVAAVDSMRGDVSRSGYIKAAALGAKPTIHSPASDPIQDMNQLTKRLPGIKSGWKLPDPVWRGTGSARS